MAKFRLTGFAAGVAAGFALAVSLGAVAQARKLSEETMQQLRRFTDIYGTVKTTYAGPIDEAKLFDGCIAGLLRNLDPQSAYMDRDEFEQLKAPARAGIGIEITSAGAHTRIVSPIEGSPADRAGVLPGDVITGIDQAEVAGLPLSGVTKLLVGPAGSRIRLTLARPGVTAPVELDLTRELIRVQSVRSELLGQGIAYVRIAQFREQTPQLLAEALEKLTGANAGPLKGLIIDLRNNPGGVFNGGVSVAAAFLDEGLPIVTMDGPSQESRRRFAANAADAGPLRAAFLARVPQARTVPMAVLVNGGSAAASEIVAAALQEHKRATIVGEKTFGRGSIQTIFPYGNDTAIKLTTAYTFTPKGRPIHGQGVTPDIAAEADSKPPSSGYGPGDAIVRRAAEILNRQKS